MPIKNLIFDLGGVIIDIDYNRTFEAFKKHGVHHFDEAFNQGKQEAIFDEYETGRISSDEFRKIIKDKLKLFISDEEFDCAWNAMLLDLPKERLDFIKGLRKNYKVFLFSNTNDIHLKKVFSICEKQHGFNNFLEYFEKEYYSNIFGKRKPDVASFISILNENKLKAEETVFIDDTLQNIHGASEAGLHVIHLTKDKSIFDIIEHIKALET
ncbi:MAG TPA: HAD family phosphatase [Gammaproteobacteria bacterium]|jgi:putative hydrolase of the HAD superfamily|nr:HAD family phosphatase [Gammaproteobacteria bacterium]